MNPEERPNLISEQIKDDDDLTWEHMLDQAPLKIAPPAEPAQVDPIYLLVLIPTSFIVSAAMLYGALFYAEVIFNTIIAILVAIPFSWLLISSLRPAMPDRECPKCHTNNIVLIDPQQEHGIRCLKCPFVDREKRIPYLKVVMNDPEIAKVAGFVIDDYGEAQLPKR